MASILPQDPATGLERSCDGTRDWIRVAPSYGGVERSEAFFAARGFAPHRHDTYSIGITLEGVQCSRYRGGTMHSVAGQVFVLHPDEIHDGRAGTRNGFRYRTIYVDPWLIGAALDRERAPLPFVRQGISDNPRIAATIVQAFDDVARPLDALLQNQIVLELAEAMAEADKSIKRRPLSAVHWRAVRQARELLDASIQDGVGSEEIEAATGLTRYALARHFRACLGTSPYRYLVMRRLDCARELIRTGSSLADAALASGFADQAHMTRHFKRAYGMPPGQWAARIA